MESSTQPSSILHTFKSKKKLQIGSNPNDASSTGAPSMDPWSSKTPEKPITAPRRTRNRSTTFIERYPTSRTEALQTEPDSGCETRPDPPGETTRVRVSSSSAKGKKHVDSVKLPEKYELLVEFFSRMANSIRLLKLKGSSTTFTNISTKVECLTDRKFTYNHLAQIKFLLPEAIEVKKMLVFDERTSCMKPDLHITLNANGVEVDEKLKSSSGNVQLWDVFHHRIVDFFKSHPEGDDIPEEALPGAFGMSKQELLTNSSSPAGPQSIDETPISPMQKPLIAVSHLAQSFRKSFSYRASIGAEPEIANCSTNTSKAVNKTPSKLLSTGGVRSVTLPPSPLSSTPLKNTKGEDCSSFISTESTPAKFTSTPAKLMASTPAIQPPKRCYMSPDGESTESPIKLARRPPPSRLLTFDTPVKSSKVTADDEILDILNGNLLQSIRDKEQKALEENDPAISQAKWRKKMISSLPKFFDMIYFLFQSMKRSVITKEELMHKVISSHLDIADKREVEEQLWLLQEIAPEWISEKLSSSGDLLLRVSKVSNAESIRARIAQAK